MGNDMTLGREFPVNFKYQVRFTRGALDARNPALRDALSGESPRAGVILDAGLLASRPGLSDQIGSILAAIGVELAFPPLVVPGGRGAKTSWRWPLETLRRVSDSRLDRHSYLLALGGGSVLDMAGFAAAVAHRGLRLVRMPTTTLAMADAGIGVKNGMDMFGQKNFVGTFAPPWAVVNDFDFLETLAEDDWLGGVAEAFKVAIIKDRAFLDFLVAHAQELRGRNPGPMEELVRRCAEIHLDHIALGGDPFETGSARPLDFGHWSAHWLETRTNYRLGHGQAVAIGIALDSCYAFYSGLLDSHELELVLDALRGSGLPVWDAALAERDGAGRLRVMDGLERFREHLGGVLNITLPSGLGAKEEIHHVRPDLLENSMLRLRP